MDAKKTLQIRKNIDSKGVEYSWNEDVEASFNKIYYYTEPAMRLWKFAKEETGSISDCFILYAIANLGVCDYETIQMFLGNLKSRHSGLHIMDPYDKSLKLRLAALKKQGYVFAFSYRTAAGEKSLYTIDKDGNEFVSMKLSKKLPYNSWMQAKQPPEMLGWAATTYVAVKSSFDSNFVNYLDGVFRNKFIGTYYLPAEIKYAVKNIPIYVAYMEAYLILNKKTMTEDDFNEVCVRKINTIRNYLMNRSTKGPAYCVVVVQDNEDLLKMAELIVKTEILLERLDHIYFTGAGAMQEVDSSHLSDGFLKMVYEDDKFDFAAERPDFMAN